MKDRRGNNGGPARARRPPEQLASVSLDADEIIAGELDVLADTAELLDNGRRIFGGVCKLFGLPEQFARLLVERHHRAPRTTRCTNHFVAIYQRRFSEIPTAASTAEILHKILSPNFLSIGGLQAN